MKFSLQEIDHLIKALDTMSTYDIARAREQIVPGATEHEELKQKLKYYRYRLSS